MAKDFAGEPLLYHLTVLHHCNEVADLRGYPEIVRDEDDRKTETLAQFRK